MNKTLLWLPIDIPKFPRPDLIMETRVNWAFWSFTRFTETQSTGYAVTDFTREFQTQYPEIVAWFQHFPFKTIRNIKYNLQTQEVAAHQDFTRPDLDPALYENNQQNEPCGYRILIRGTRSRVLYVQDQDQRIYTTLPETTDVYVLRHSDGVHGVLDDQNRTTIFTHFEIDSAKHENLIARSLAKYRDYAVFSNRKPRHA